MKMNNLKLMPRIKSKGTVSRLSGILYADKDVIFKILDRQLKMYTKGMNGYVSL